MKCLNYHFEIVYYLSFFSYGGPGTQEVSQRWSFDWDHYLASSKDFIVATMDVRGSGFSGNEFRHAVYNKLGTLETEDTLNILG